MTKTQMISTVLEHNNKKITRAQMKRIVRNMTKEDVAEAEKVINSCEGNAKWKLLFTTMIKWKLM